MERDLDMEDLYQQEIARQMSDAVAATNHVPMSMYEGEHAFRLMLHCVKMGPIGYRFKMVNLNHDTLMQVLSHVRDILPRPKSFTPRRSRIREELETIGLGYLSRYIISHRKNVSKEGDQGMYGGVTDSDGSQSSYTLDIYPITYEQATFICRSLFAW